MGVPGYRPYLWPSVAAQAKPDAFPPVVGGRLLGGGSPIKKPLRAHVWPW